MGKSLVLAMRHGRLDALIEFSIAELACGDTKRVNQLVRNLALEWETESALAICFALTSAAATLERQFKGEDKHAARAYKLASLLAADIFALEAMGQHPAKAHHLLQFWQRTDPYFLEI